MNESTNARQPVDTTRVLRHLKKARNARKHPNVKKLLEEFENTPNDRKLDAVARTFNGDELRSRGIPFPKDGRAFAVAQPTAEDEVTICLKGSTNNHLFEIEWDFGCFTIDI